MSYGNFSHGALGGGLEWAKFPLLQHTRSTMVMVYGVLYTANISLTSYALMAFGSGFARYWFLAQQRHRLLLERDRAIESANCIFLL
jgi:hypothetical protein